MNDSGLFNSISSSIIQLAGRKKETPQAKKCLREVLRLWDSFQNCGQEKEYTKRHIMQLIIPQASTLSTLRGDFWCCFPDPAYFGSTVCAYFSAEIKTWLQNFGAKDAVITKGLAQNLLDWLISPIFMGYITILEALMHSQPHAKPAQYAAFKKSLSTSSIPSSIISFLDLCQATFKATQNPTFPSTCDFSHCIGTGVDLGTKEMQKTATCNLFDALELLCMLVPIPQAFQDMVSRGFIVPLLMMISSQMQAPVAVNHKFASLAQHAILSAAQHHSDADFVDLLVKYNGLHILLTGFTNFSQYIQDPKSQRHVDLQCALLLITSTIFFTILGLIEASLSVSHKVLLDFEKNENGYHALKNVILLLQPIFNVSLGENLQHANEVIDTYTRFLFIREKAVKENVLFTDASAKTHLGTSIKAGIMAASRKAATKAEEALTQLSTEKVSQKALEIQDEIDAKVFNVLLIETICEGNSTYLLQSLLRELEHTMRTCVISPEIISSLSRLVEHLPKMTAANQMIVVDIIEKTIFRNDNANYLLGICMTQITNHHLSDHAVNLILATIAQSIETMPKSCALPEWCPQFFDMISALLQKNQEKNNSNSATEMETQALTFACVNLMEGRGHLYSNLANAGIITQLCTLLNHSDPDIGLSVKHSLTVLVTGRDHVITSGVDPFKVVMAEIHSCVDEVLLQPLLLFLLKLISIPRHHHLLSIKMQQYGGLEVLLNLLESTFRQQQPSLVTMEILMALCVLCQAHSHHNTIHFWNSMNAYQRLARCIETASTFLVDVMKPLMQFLLDMATMRMATPSYIKALILRLSPDGEDSHMEEGLLIAHGFAIPSNPIFYDSQALMLLYQVLPTCPPLMQREIIQLTKLVRDMNPINSMAIAYASHWACVTTESSLDLCLANSSIISGMELSDGHETPIWNRLIHSFEEHGDSSAWNLMTYMAQLSLPWTVIPALSKPLQKADIPGTISMFRSLMTDTFMATGRHGTGSTDIIGPAWPCVHIGITADLHMPSINCAWPPQSGYSYAAWFCVRNPLGHAETKMATLHLLRFDDDEAGYPLSISLSQPHCSKSSWRLSVVVRGSTCTFHKFIFHPEKWYHVVVTHVKHRLRSSMVSLFVNGVHIDDQSLSYCKRSNDSGLADHPTTRAYIGVEYSDAESSQGGVEWLMGPWQIYDYILGALEVRIIYALGPSKEMASSAPALPHLREGFHGTSLPSSWHRFIRLSVEAKIQLGAIESLYRTLGGDSNGEASVAILSFHPALNDFVATTSPSTNLGLTTEIWQRALMNAVKGDGHPYLMMSRQCIVYVCQYSLRRHVCETMGLPGLLQLITPHCDTEHIGMHVDLLLEILASNYQTKTPKPEDVDSYFPALVQYMIKAISSLMLHPNGPQKVQFIANTILSLMVDSTTPGREIAVHQDLCLLLLEPQIWRLAAVKTQLQIYNVMSHRLLDSTNTFAALNISRLVAWGVPRLLLKSMIESTSKSMHPKVAMSISDYLIALAQYEPKKVFRSLVNFISLLHLKGSEPQTVLSEPNLPTTPRSNQKKPEPQAEPQAEPQPESPKGLQIDTSTPDPLSQDQLHSPRAVPLSSIRGLEPHQCEQVRNILLKCLYDMLTLKLETPRSAVSCISMEWILSGLHSMSHPVSAALIIRICSFMIHASRVFEAKWNEADMWTRIRPRLEPYCNQEDLLLSMAATMIDSSVPALPDALAPGSRVSGSSRDSEISDLFNIEGPAHPKRIIHGSIQLLSELMRLNSLGTKGPAIYRSIGLTYYFSHILPKYHLTRRWALLRNVFRVSFLLKKGIPKAISEPASIESTLGGDAYEAIMKLMTDLLQCNAHFWEAFASEDMICTLVMTILNEGNAGDRTFSFLCKIVCRSFEMRGKGYYNTTHILQTVLAALTYYDGHALLDDKEDGQIFRGPLHAKTMCAVLERLDPNTKQINADGLSYLDQLVEFSIDFATDAPDSIAEAVMDFHVRIISMLGSITEEATSSRIADRVRRHLNRAVLMYIGNEQLGNDATRLAESLNFLAQRVLPTVITSTNQDQEFLACSCVIFFNFLRSESEEVRDVACNIWRSFMTTCEASIIRVVLGFSSSQQQSSQDLHFGFNLVLQRKPDSFFAWVEANSDIVLGLFDSKLLPQWNSLHKRSRQKCTNSIQQLRYRMSKLTKRSSPVPANIPILFGSITSSKHEYNSSTPVHSYISFVQPHSFVWHGWYEILNVPPTKAHQGVMKWWQTSLDHSKLHIRHRTISLPDPVGVPKGMLPPQCPEIDEFDEMIGGHVFASVELYNGVQLGLLHPVGCESDDAKRLLTRILNSGDQVLNIRNASRIRQLEICPVLFLLTTRNLIVVHGYTIDVNGALRTHPSLGFAPPPPMGSMLRFPLPSIRQVFKRRYMQRHVALEVQFDWGVNIHLIMRDLYGELSETSRSEVYQTIVRMCQSQLPRHLPSIDGNEWKKWRSSMTRKWQTWQISTFEYLMHLNVLAGRSYNDLNQYPVFPWVLKDYTSATIDIKDPSIYRDLTKPMGAQDSSRAQRFQQRYNDWCDPTTPPFHYGTHYSSAGFVLYYLIRIQPFTSLNYHLQDGKLDQSSRLFHSLQSTWEGASSRELANVKELIPEFFFLPDCLVNVNGIDLGLRPGTDEPLGDVTLPPWCGGDPAVFIKLHREALEGEWVSANIHHWIDLIFGYKQQGSEAEKALNVFHPLTYEAHVQQALNEAEGDVAQTEAIMSQVALFGRTPHRLFSKPHPSRQPRSAAIAEVGETVPSIRVRAATAAGALVRGFSLSPAKRRECSITHAVVGPTADPIDEETQSLEADTGSQGQHGSVTGTPTWPPMKESLGSDLWCSFATRRSSGLGFTGTETSSGKQTSVDGLLAASLGTVTPSGTRIGSAKNMALRPELWSLNVDNAGDDVSSDVGESSFNSQRSYNNNPELGNLNWDFAFDALPMPHDSSPNSPDSPAVAAEVQTREVTRRPKESQESLPKVLFQTPPKTVSFGSQQLGSTTSRAWMDVTNSVTTKTMTPKTDQPAHLSQMCQWQAIKTLEVSYDDCHAAHGMCTFVCPSRSEYLRFVGFGPKAQLCRARDHLITGHIALPINMLDITSVASSQCGALVFMGTRYGVIYVASLNYGSEAALPVAGRKALHLSIRGRLAHHIHAITVLLIDADNSLMVSCTSSPDDFPVVWKCTLYSVQKICSLHHIGTSGVVTCGTINNHNGDIVLCTSDGSIRVWNSRGHLTAMIPEPEEYTSVITSVAFLHHSKLASGSQYLATGHGGGTLQIFIVDVTHPYHTPLDGEPSIQPNLIKLSAVLLADSIREGYAITSIGSQLVPLQAPWLKECELQEASHSGSKELEKEWYDKLLLVYGNAAGKVRATTIFIDLSCSKLI